jgi:hypothetical protein
MSLLEVDGGSASIPEGKITSSLAKEIQRANDLHVYKDIGAPGTIYVCFRPQSKAMQTEAANACQDRSAPRIRQTSICEGEAELFCIASETAVDEPLPFGEEEFGVLDEGALGQEFEEEQFWFLDK